MTARKHLVKMLEQLINENEEEARIAFHDFVVSSARTIHESVLAEDELDDEIEDGNSEEYFGQDDMSDEGEYKDGMEMSDDDAEEDLEDNGEMDMDMDMEAGEEIEVEKDDIADALDAMEELTAKFQALLGDTEEEMDYDDSEMEPEMEPEMDIEPEMEPEMEESVYEMKDEEIEEGKACDDNELEEAADCDDEELEEAVSHSGGVVSAKSGVDPEGKHSTRDSIKANSDAKLAEDEADTAFDFDLTEEDFEDLEEGLKAIDVRMGGEQGGSKFAGEETQTKSPVAKRDMSDVKAGSKDMISKNADHSDYKLEDAPKNDSLPHAGDNSKGNAAEGRSEISGHGGLEAQKGRADSEAGAGKFAGTEVNTKSPIGSKGTRNGR